MTGLAVTVIGADRPGIVAAVTAALAEVGGNLEDTSSTILRGHFAMTLILTAPAGAAAVQAALQPVADRLGLVTAVREVTEPPAGPVFGQRYLLTVHGADRPGIVAAVSGAVADQGGNITELTSRLVGRLYVLTMELELPPGADPATLDAALSRLGSHLDVRVLLRPVEPDVL